MDYAIKTLEIKIAELRQALRKYDQTILTYEDSRGGHFPDFNGMRVHIDELEHAIEVLKRGGR